MTLRGIKVTLRWRANLASFAVGLGMTLTGQPHALAAFASLLAIAVVLVDGTVGPWLAATLMQGPEDRLQRRRNRRAVDDC